MPLNVACDDKTKIVMNLNVQNQAILLLFYKLQSVWAYYFKVSSSSTACTFTLFAVRLSHLVLTSCYLELFEVNPILCDVVKTLHVIVGFFFLLSVILFANQNFLDDFSNWL